MDGGKGAAERRKRTHVLLLSDRGQEHGGRTDADIASVLDRRRPDIENAGNAGLAEVAVVAVLSSRKRMPASRRSLDPLLSSRISRIRSRSSSSSRT